MKGAFDNVDPNILLQDIRALGVPALTRKFIANLLFKRKNFFVEQGSLVDPLVARKGTPQSSSLSPLLSDVYLRDIVSVVRKDNHILQYADDIIIMTASKNISTAREKIQSALNYLQKYLNSKRLNVAPFKSNLMVIDRRRKAAPFLPIQINGEKVPIVNKTRFLGIILDRFMSGKEHLKFLCQRGKKL